MRTAKTVVTGLLFTILCASPSSVLAQGKAKGHVNKTVGGCPHSGKWDLVSLGSLGLDNAVGLPSIDGNGDGMTCVLVQALRNGKNGMVFRDNNVKD